MAFPLKRNTPVYATSRVFPDGVRTGGRAQKNRARCRHRARSVQRLKLDQPPLEDDIGAVEAAGGAIGAVVAGGGVIAVEAGGGVIAGAVAAGAAIVEDAAAPLF